MKHSAYDMAVIIINSVLIAVAGMLGTGSETMFPSNIYTGSHSVAQT